MLVSLGMGGDATGMTVGSIPEVGPEVMALVPTDREAKETYIRADFDVPYDSVMQLMNRLRDSGIKKIGLVGEATS